MFKTVLQKMSTSATIKIISSDKQLECYVHYDGGIKYLGNKILSDLKYLLKTYDKEVLSQMISKIKCVDAFKSVEPTKQEIEKFKQFSNLTIYPNSYTNWRCLIYETSNSLKDMIEHSILLIAQCYGDYEYVLDFNKGIFKELETELEISFDNLPKNL